MDDRIIIRAEEEVVCPKCSHGFPLRAGIARQTIERHREEFEQATTAFRDQICH